VTCLSTAAPSASSWGPKRPRRPGPYAGKQVIFGLRPEDIHDREFTPPGMRVEPITAEVDVTELMGNEIFVYLLTGQKQFIARVDPRTKAGSVADGYGC
jgi:ABC-type sugar transport system ATPase subunit